ncbi:MAG: sensor histidine kinase [Acidimicrobiales bacterium]
MAGPGPRHRPGRGHRSHGDRRATDRSAARHGRPVVQHGRPDRPGHEHPGRHRRGRCHADVGVDPGLQRVPRARAAGRRGLAGAGRRRRRRSPEPARGHRRRRGTGRPRRGDQGRGGPATRRRGTLHIARELHDVVAHHIAVINVQAGVAAHLLHTSPDGAETALATVRSSAHDVLDELAGILGVLRAGDDDSASTHPTPTVEDLPALVDSFAQAGLDVTFETAGEAHPTGDVAAIAVYRTVQEALTNAHKHGAGAARVRLENRPDELELTVTNPVGAAVAATSGYGLVGMRERVQAAGGSLDTGTRPDGTFVVHVCFPRTRRQEQS